MTSSDPVIAVVIPCYKVSGKIRDVLLSIPSLVKYVICVDDACPEKTGALIESACTDPRVSVLYHESNKGVGGAMVTGYRAAQRAGADIIVKLDGDGQMNPALISLLITPILKGQANYTKGNRFFRPDDLDGMPPMRLFGNSILSFLTKLSSGYWDIFDPTNGFTAVDAITLQQIPLEKIDPSYFFESDMLFRLNIARAVVRDIPMKALYNGERSNLKIRSVILPFLRRHACNFFKRIFYNYFLRDFHIASFYIIFGFLFFFFGVIFGAMAWHHSDISGIPASAGTVMLGALPIIMGFQMLLAFLHSDIESVPKIPLQGNI